MERLSGLWPELDWDEWKGTAETLHMFTQMVGKTRLALTPVQNHWWNVPLYLTARGLTTSAMPLADGSLLDIEFDFLAHELVFRSSSGQVDQLALSAQPVADFFANYKKVLNGIAGEIPIHSLPVECANPIRFEEDTINKSYDRDAVSRFWRILFNTKRLFTKFSTNFYGKISPVHFFWGSFDLAVTRFNGRKAPAREGSDAIQKEAYSHECISAGFWPGNGGYGKAAFYSYAAPVPKGLGDASLRGLGGFNQAMGEFLLDYEEVRRAPDPDQGVLDFLEETYDAAANAAGWDRANLDRTDAVGVAAVRAKERN